MATITQQQYQFQPGETVDQYNARIAALRGETTPSNNGTSNNSNDTYTQLYNQLKDYLDKLMAKGQALNPNIEISPEKAAEFLAQAQSEIDPYYASQLKLARQGLLSSLGYSEQQVLQNEANLEQKYNLNLRQLGEQSAEQGFAQSGIRQQQERQLAMDTQQQINQQRQQFAQGARTLGGEFAQKYGQQNVEIPNMPVTPQVSLGEINFQRTGLGAPLYQLSPDVYNGLVGEQQYAQTAAEKQRASKLESAYRTQQQAQQQRQLNLNP